MNDDRICGFCHKPPEQGKLLSCQHVFCLKCLTNQLLKHFDEKVKKDGFICLLCPTFTQLDIKWKKRFNLNLDKSNSKRLYVISNLDKLLPDLCQSTYEDYITSNVTTSASTVPKNHSDQARWSVGHEANIAGNANDDTFTTPFHNEFLRQSSTLFNPCQCSTLKNWRCKTCNQTFCESCVSNHLADESKIHELFNQFQCIYCLGTKTWHCNFCDKPLCSGCLAIHLEESGKHEVVTTEEQKKSVRTANFQQGASSSSAPWDPIFDLTPSAPIYYSATPEAKSVNGQHASDAPLVSTQELTAKKLINGIDEDYRPPAEYITWNEKFNVPSFSDKPPPPIPKRPSPIELHSAGVQYETCPPEVKPILHLNNQPWVPKKFCIDNAGQIFILFAENSREICRFDRHSGTSLSSIKNQMNIIDMDYNEKSDTLLLLSENDNSDFYFLQKYNVFNSKLVDVFELGSEHCLFIVPDKRNHQQVFVVMLDKIKLYNFVRRSFEQKFFSFTSSMPDTSTLIAIESNEKGSLYLLFSTSDMKISVFAFLSLDFPVPVPLPVTKGITDIAINRNTLCFADPQRRRALLFEKGPTKEFVEISNEVCTPNKYSWKPQLLTISDDEMLIMDSESKTLYSWTLSVKV